MAHFLALGTSSDAESIANIFFKNIVRLHGLPLSIVSDRDPHFTGKFWTSLMKLYGT